jgi:hypothetical protein
MQEEEALPYVVAGSFALISIRDSILRKHISLNRCCIFCQSLSGLTRFDRRYTISQTNFLQVRQSIVPCPSLERSS